MGSVHIVGAGVAGFSLAHTLIQAGYDGSITLSDPQGLPYDRPPLSKTLERVNLAPPAWFIEHSVQLQPQHIDQVEAPQSEQDWLVLATGTTPRKLQVPGAEHARVIHTAKDAEALSQKLSFGAFGTRVVVIGAGLIGAEFAAAARQFGATVTLLSNQQVPLINAFGEPMARQLHEDHRLNGIRVVTGVAVRITESSVEVNQESIEADIVVAAIGVEPDLTLADTLGLETNNGIIVDAAMRTSVPQVLAIGDVAREAGARPLRHWDRANEDAALAAATIMGTSAPRRKVPWFWSDRHESHVEVVGDFTSVARTVARHTRQGKIQVLFGLDEQDRLVAASMVDGGLMGRAVRKLIEQEITPPIEDLEDSGITPRNLGRKR
ncbi:NAD(P)/FAD-dependent oxidoreductase [Glutamicibacter creatinolyticus]|uniref:NAD(P)/FAD-dependent oxidoreductase n=1 Tax=Glutamicibacter creatinolyticus TaxID=162496 RepID=UPI0031D8C38E